MLHGHSFCSSLCSSPPIQTLIPIEDQVDDWGLITRRRNPNRVPSPPPLNSHC
ncbi:hypothetical protein HanRHA438_Chr11g0520281 [Helianthus annuus]|nr:hypothetical protein HanRHA438_Chr11g0520281 [Helianthus annuus]